MELRKSRREMGRSMPRDLSSLAGLFSAAGIRHLFTMEEEQNSALAIFRSKEMGCYHGRSAGGRMSITRTRIRSTTVALTTIALLASAALARDQRLTAREVIARIQQQVGVPWQSDTVDTFKAGNPDIPVTGIAVTMMATLDVLQRAAAAGDNLIITHEPTFFDHLDTADQLPEKDNDPVLTEKRQFIEKHGLVIWRFHDHWHARTPDGIETGMVHALGWEKFQDSTQSVFVQHSGNLARKAGVRDQAQAWNTCHAGGR